MASSSSAPASPAPSHALFLASSAYLPTAPSAASLPTEVKLRLYGLFKLLSTPPSGGDVSGAGGPPTARPSFWQVEARSKWDAWAAAEKEFGSKGEDGRTDARRAYVEIARSVGFEETEQTAAAAPVEDDVDLEHLSSDDERDRQAEQHARPAAGSGSTSAATERKPGGGGVGGKSISRLRETLPEPAEGAVEAETDPLSRPPWSLVSDPAALRQHLAAHPAAINAFSPTGQTLLHLAADGDQSSTVSLLLELGADRNLRDRAPADDDDVGDDEDEGMTAREMAEINGFDRVVALLA